MASKLYLPETQFRVKHRTFRERPPQYPCLEFLACNPVASPHTNPLGHIRILGHFGIEMPCESCKITWFFFKKLEAIRQ